MPLIYTYKLQSYALYKLILALENGLDIDFEDTKIEKKKKHQNVSRLISSDSDTVHYL